MRIQVIELGGIMCVMLVDDPGMIQIMSAWYVTKPGRNCDHKISRFDLLDGNTTKSDIYFFEFVIYS